MNPPKIEPTPRNVNPTHAQPVQTPPPTPVPEASKSKVKAVTIQLSEDVHQKLRIVALSKGATTSGLVESYVEAALKKDLIVAMARLSEG